MNKLVLNQWLGIIEISKFIYRKQRYYSLLKKKEEPEDIRSCLNTLKKDGILIIPDFLSREKIDEMYNNLPSKDKFEESVEGDKSLFLLNANEINCYKPFFESGFIKKIIQAYISESAVPIRQSIEWKHKGGFVQSFDRLFHMDTWKHRVKAFLYLHKVTDEHAPLHYLKGSNKGIWRLPMEAQLASGYKVNKRGYALNENLSYIGCYLPNEIDRLKELYGFEEVTCTGEAGTLIIFDARGLHRATELKSEARKILISYWVQKNHHI